MVKVNDKGEEMASPGNGPSSSEGEESFVVLERSSLQDHNSQFPNGAQPQISHLSFGSSSLLNHPHETPSSNYIPASLPDLKPEEIERKLQEVLQENVELKETLHQNNLAIKQQFNTLVMWQDEVFKVHQSHKEKFQETKELILKLKAENLELKNYLEKCGSSSDTQLKAENAKLKGQIAELQQKLTGPMPRRDLPHGAPSKKEEELTDLVKQLNTQLETAERARRQLSIEVESLAARRIRTEREAAELQITLAEQIKKGSEMEKKNSELTQKVQHYENELRSFVMIDNKESQHSGASTLQTVTTELDEAQSQVEELKKQVESEKEIKNQLFTQMQRQEQYLQELKKKIQLQQQQQQSPQKQTLSSATTKDEEGFSSLLLCCEEQLKELNKILFRQTERHDNLNKWLRSTADNLRPWQPSRTSDAQNVLGLKSEIEQLMNLLAQEQAFAEEMKICLTENQNNFQKIFGDYKNLWTEWENYNQEQKDKERHNADYLGVQAKGFSEKLDYLLAQVLCKDEELKENEKKIKEYDEKIKKLQLENESISILKAQVEVYQSDFNAEREARENLAGEKERLADDLRNLQRRNQQILEELETYQRNNFESMQARNSGGSNWGTIATPGRTSANASVNLAVNPDRNQRHSPEIEPSPPRVYDEEVPPPKEFVCPICKTSFRQLDLLEYHIETCLDS